MSMPIKACGGAEFFRGACRDRYLGRRDCADCEPLTKPAGEPADQGDGVTVSVDPTSADLPAADAPPSDPPTDPTSAGSPAKPRAPRGAPKRP